MIFKVFFHFNDLQELPEGRATLPRILLRMSGLKWKDTLVPNNQKAWNEQKPDWDRDALGALPVLKLNGQIFYQTHAIEQWVRL